MIFNSHTSHNQPDVRPVADSYPSGVPRQLDYPWISAWELLKRAADQFPQRVGCCYYDQRWTYLQLWEEAGRTAAVLKDAGVKPGDRVALLMPNVPEYIIALNAIWMAGGVAVAVSPLMVPEEVAGLMKSTDCRVCISLDMLYPLVADGDFQPEHTFLVTLGDWLPTFESWGYFLMRWRRTGQWRMGGTESVHWLNEEAADREPDNNPVRVSPHDSPAYILPTGGTTGCPKAVVLSHQNLVANAWQQMHWAGRRMGEETFLAVLPFFHSYGLSASMNTGIALAATLVVHHRFKAGIVLRLMEEHRPTILHAVPAMLKALNENLQRKPRKLNSLRWVISGGAPLDAAIADEFAEHTGAGVVEGFGLSETSPVTHVGPLDGRARYGTIGLPLPDTNARIVDIETGTETLPIGVVGELVIQGPQVMLGYWKDEQLTKQTIRNGWLHTGDLAVQEEDGFFRIVDRIKDLIITSGFNVYPADVEAVLRMSPDVADAAVIAEPDAKRGQIVKAIIVLNKGVKFDRNRLDKFCSEHLSKHKRPRLIEVVDDLPRNFLGKVLRRKLYEEPDDKLDPQQSPVDATGTSNETGNGNDAPPSEDHGDEMTVRNGHQGESHDATK